MVNIEVVVPDSYSNRSGPRSWKVDLHALPGSILPAYLHALTPKESGVNITTSNLHNPNYQTSADYVFLSFATANAPVAYNVAETYKRLGKKVIFGGVHVNSLEKIGLLSEAEQFSDSICLGEADNIWTEIIEDVNTGNLKEFYDGSLADLSSSPILNQEDRSLLKKTSFFSPFSSVRTSEGCPNKCEFCSVYQLFGNKYRFRDIDEIVEEIQNIPKKFSMYGNKRYVTFTDDNLLGKKSHGMSLLEELAEMGDVAWIGGISSDLITEDVADKLAESGAVSVFIGFDKFSGEDMIGKHQDRYEHAVRLLHDRGISVEGAVIVGYDTDTEETFRKIEDFMLDNKIEIPSLNILTAYPGTDLWNRISEENRLLFPVNGENNNGENWAHYTTEEVNIKPIPKGISQEELFDNYMDLWKSLTSVKGIAKRFKGKWLNPAIIPNIAMNIYLHDGVHRVALRKLLKLAGKLTQ